MQGITKYLQKEVSQISVDLGGLTIDIVSWL